MRETLDLLANDFVLALCHTTLEKKNEKQARHFLFTAIKSIVFVVHEFAVNYLGQYFISFSSIFKVPCKIIRYNNIGHFGL